MAKIVKKCRRCGHTFEEKRLSPIKVQASNESYVELRTRRQDTEREVRHGNDT